MISHCTLSLAAHYETSLYRRPLSGCKRSVVQQNIQPKASKFNKSFLSLANRMHNALWVFVGGGTGALLRYGVSVLVNWVGWHNTISTLLVNILGSFLLGWISVSCTGSIRTNDTFRLLLAVGLCGGFTTFGTFSSDIVNLLRNGAWAQALAYAFCSVLLSVAAFGCAFLLQSPSRA